MTSENEISYSSYSLSETEVKPSAQNEPMKIDIENCKLSNDEKQDDSTDTGSGTDKCKQCKN